MAEPIELSEVLVTPEDNINHGGTADWWDPHGTPNPYYGFVISGGHTNQDPISAVSGLVPAADAQYYHGFWAGVQGALYGSQPQTNPFLSFGFTPEFSPFGPHSYGFATNVLEALAQPPTHDLTARVAAAARALGNVSHPFELWLTPSDSASTSWAFGNGPDDWPSDLPDWGDRAPGPLPPMPTFSPIKGKTYDIFSFIIPDAPTEQEIQDAGNPALWLLPSSVGTMDTSISTPAPEPVFLPDVGDFPFNITPDTSIPSVATPGNIISDVTPRGDWTD